MTIQCLQIPAYSDNWTSVYSVDALTGAQSLEPKSVHTIITSPPYWSLRSYLPSEHPDKALELGSEPTPELYVERLVEILRACGEVLRDDGTLWLNISDNYGARKQLQGIPWRVAFALQFDGWILRCDCIWAKPNPMPESVTDRPTKSHEYMFLLTKSPRYFFDQEAVREPAINGERFHGGYSAVGKAHQSRNGRGDKDNTTSGRNIRSVWNIATRPYPGSHYATFPPDLVYPCIKAGTSEYGVCEKCLAPWERVVEREPFARPPEKLYGGTLGHNPTGKVPGSNTRGMPDRDSRTVGWQPTCSCSASTIPATVFDPFMGSGTTALAARKLGRRSIGFDLDTRNIQQIEERLGYQGVLL